MSQSMQNISQHTIQQWLVDNMDVDQIKELLQSKGLLQSEIDSHLNAFNKAKIIRRQMSGIIFMGVGAAVGLIGCVIAIVHPSATLYYVGLYGLTSVAVILAFMGLYRLME